MRRLWTPSARSTTVDDRSSYRWATVTDVAPLRIRFDGDTVELPLTPDSLVPLGDLEVGSRVWVQHYGRRLLVLGVSGGPAAPVIHTIGATGEPAFQNGWVNYNSAFGNAHFYREGGRVYLSGLVRNGTASSGTTGIVFTLPAGFIPPQQEIFNAWSSTGAARVDVLTDGTVRVISYAAGGANTFVSLAGISFRAA